MLELFDKLIQPVLNYGCEVWGFDKANDIEIVHKSFCKSVLGVKSTTLNEFVYGELGRYPLIINRYAKIIKYWCKILYSHESTLIKQVYHFVYSNPDFFVKNSWIKDCPKSKIIYLL